jgi:hypothetical protein
VRYVAVLDLQPHWQDVTFGGLKDLRHRGPIRLPELWYQTGSGHPATTIRSRSSRGCTRGAVCHTQEAVEVRLPNPGQDLLTGKEHSSNLVLDLLEVAILKERRYA